MESIFHKIVSNEDSYTQLLCNLLKRCTEFRVAMLNRFFSPNVANTIRSNHLRTQKILKDCGRADLFIETEDACGIVEVKTELGRNTESSQNCDQNEQNQEKSYLSYLWASKRTHKSLIYLVPKNWLFLPDHEQRLGGSALTSRDVEVKTLYWEDVLKVLQPLSSQCPLLQEFRLLLEHRFGPITFSNEELAVLNYRDDSIRQIWKLHRLIDAVARKLQRSKYKVDWGPGGDDYGYCVLKDQKTLLYFGCWPDFWRIEGNPPLCFGIEHKWESGGLHLRDVFKDFGMERSECVDGWTCSGVAEEDLTSDDAVERIWARMQKLLENLDRRAR